MGSEAGSGGEKLATSAARARDRPGASGIGEILISISHCRTDATAYAIALGRPSSVATPAEPVQQD